MFAMSMVSSTVSKIGFTVLKQMSSTWGFLVHRSVMACNVACPVVLFKESVKFSMTRVVQSHSRAAADDKDWGAQDAQPSSKKKPLKSAKKPTVRQAHSTVIYLTATFDIYYVWLLEQESFAAGKLCENCQVAQCALTCKGEQGYKHWMLRAAVLHVYIA